jgi:hypothetical protein
VVSGIPKKKKKKKKNYIPTNKRRGGLAVWLTRSPGGMAAVRTRSATSHSVVNQYGNRCQHAATRSGPAAPLGCTLGASPPVCQSVDSALEAGGQAPLRGARAGQTPLDGKCSSERPSHIPAG